MAESGYSGKPLWQKLGLPAGAFYCEVPPGEAIPEYWREAPFESERLPEPRPALEFLHLFVTTKRQLLKRVAVLLPLTSKTVTWWVSWPKKASGRGSDVTEDTLRDVFLPLGLVDVKVCSVTDDLWSGLKLVWRKELR